MSQHMNYAPRSLAPTPVIHIDDVSIRFNGGAFTAVDHLSLAVPSGQVLGILGGNGAGKTTTMRALAGIQPVSDGRLHVAGHDMGTLKGSEAARRVLGYCPDVGGLIRQATIREHVGVVLGLRDKLDLWPYALDLIDKFGLSAFLDTPTAGFSHGMSRRLSVVLAALSASRLLILDEPFDGVDPVGVRATKQVIRDAREAGLTVLVCTHLLPLLVDVSDRIVVLVGGKKVADSPADEFSGPEGADRYAALLARP